MENNITNSFVLANGIKKLILDAFGASTSNEQFTWDLNAFVEWIKNDEGVKSELDIYKLSRDEMILLGFGVIKDTECLSIPAWLYQFIPDELAVVPEGSKDYVVMNKNDFDKELINGCFKYGILPSDANKGE